MILVTSRTASSRLPQKALREIGGIPTVEICMRRAKLTGKPVIVCTTDLKEDDIIEVIAKCNNVLCHRGSEKDIIARYWGAFQEFGCEKAVTYQADNLMMDFELLNLGLEQLERDDFINEPEGIVQGAFSMGFTRDALREAYETKKSNDTEMIWEFFKCKPKPLEINDPVYFDDIRMSLDYEEDFEFFQKVFERFDYTAPLREVIPNIKDLAHINFFRKQDWFNNQKKVIAGYR